MSFKAFLHRCLIQFFMINTFVTLATAIAGLVIDPTAQFGYESYFSPLIFSSLSMLPSFITFSRLELTVRQLLIRKIIHLIALETILIAFGIWMNILNDFQTTFLFAMMVMMVDVAVNLISYLMERKESTQINQTLKILQGRHQKTI